VLSSPDARAFSTINSKRVDLLVISSDGEPLAAIEYQGSGHYRETAPARDAVKKEARSAGPASAIWSSGLTIPLTTCRARFSGSPGQGSQSRPIEASKSAIPPAPTTGRRPIRPIISSFTDLLRASIPRPHPRLRRDGMDCRLKAGNDEGSDGR
jgi:hypothetical protein